jgi:hypothetical protein
MDSRFGCDVICAFLLSLHSLACYHAARHRDKPAISRRPGRAQFGHTKGQMYTLHFSDVPFCALLAAAWRLRRCRIGQCLIKFCVRRFDPLDGRIQSLREERVQAAPIPV